jgi:hypothetical protein
VCGGFLRDPGSVTTAIFYFYRVRIPKKIGAFPAGKDKIVFRIAVWGYIPNTIVQSDMAFIP